MGGSEEAARLFADGDVPLAALRRQAFNLRWATQQIGRAHV